MKGGERVVAECDADGELAAHGLGELPAAASDARDGVEHGGLEEAEVDEHHAGRDVEVGVVREHRLVGGAARHEADAEARAVGGLGGARRGGGRLFVFFLPFGVCHFSPLVAV